MNTKISIVLIALIGIGLYALPSTVALFSGQHDFVNIDPTGNQIDCVKCHGDVKAELTSTGLSPVTGTPSAHAAFKCEYCHRVEAGKASGDNAYSQIIYTDGTVSRKLIVYAFDMEARNLPVDMTPTTVSTTTISGNAMGKNKVSPCYPEAAAGCTEPTTILYPPDVKSMQITALYAGGAPKDTNEATRYGMFDPSKVTWTGNVGNTTQTVNLTGAGSRSSNPGSLYHAASLVSCFECHGGDAPNAHHDAQYSACADCHYVSGSKGALANIAAGGFGLTGRADDTGVNEAHKEFTTTSDGGVTRFDEVSNGACVACHTHVAVDITYQKPSVYKFDVNFFTDGTEGLDGFGAQLPMVESHSSGTPPTVP